MRSIILLIFIFCFLFPCVAQRQSITVFTTEQGLPSNVTYQCLEDDKGFLWIGTDQGVARFDGKNFQVYGKEQGVSDIEIQQIVMEKNGRVWIRCYNNSIAYYNPIKNTFTDITHIARWLHLNAIRSLSALPDGGIQFETESGSLQYSERNDQASRVRYSTDSMRIIHVHPDGSGFRYSLHQDNIVGSRVDVYLTKGNNLLGKRTFANLGKDLRCFVDEYKLYIFEGKSSDMTVISGFDQSLDALQANTYHLKNEYYIHNFTDRYLNVFHRQKDPDSGKDIMAINVYDKKTYAYLFSLNEKVIAFHMLNDKKGNRWVSTIDSGLYLYRKPTAVTQCLQTPYNNVIFYSVMKGPDGILYAGNEKGEIVEWRGRIQKIHPVRTVNKIEWQRNIRFSQHKIFTFSDGGIFINYDKEIQNRLLGGHIESKVVMTLNDTVILSGSTTGLCHLNTVTETITPLPGIRQVVTALASMDGDEVYVGSTDGLHKYSMRHRSLSDMNFSDPLLKERIVAMCVTKDNLLWIATATNGVVVLKNGHVIGHFNERDGLSSNNLLTIIAGKEHQVWIGSSLGVSRLSYALTHDTLTCQIQNISTIDGLTSKVVNQLYYDDGKVYVATEKGVCLIPETVPVPDIKVRLAGVKINQRDTLLLDDYALEADQRSINLQFAGINLYGYFHHIVYSFDQGKSWIPIEGGTLNQGLDYGETHLWVKAVDVNKHISGSMLKLHFDVATPFWKTWWFWVMVTILIQAGIGYLLYRRQKRHEAEKKKVELAKAHLASLEQQAFVSLMNPHFMFNALNSIQHYINNQDRQNANRFLTDFALLIRKNFEAAQKAFIPLEQEMENIGLYLRLEKMRFNDKFDFEVIYEKELDPDDWMMPTMILQPLVENSILHGIMPSQIHGLLQLRLSLEGQDLLLEVIDNGIGVENSRALKQGSTHKSRGMELIHKRLQALSFFSTKELKLVYTVPFDNDKNPGNKISLLIPYDLHQAWGKAQRDIER